MMRFALLFTAFLLASPARAQECLSCWTSACSDLAKTGVPRCGQPKLAPTVKAGTLNIRAEPDARVQIDGKDAGRTPVEGFRLTPGTHRLHFEADGYAPLDARVTLQPMETRTEKYILKADGSAAKKAARPAETQANPSSEVAAMARLAGRWSETWGTPGDTDVTYHDLYDVRVSDGLHVVAVKGDQAIGGEELQGDGTLRFRVKTSFAIEYRLKLEPDGVLRGVAETPTKQVPITWERVR